jgi:hypothetical protein
MFITDKTPDTEAIRFHFEIFMDRSFGFWKSTRQYTYYERKGSKSLAKQHWDCTTYFQIAGEWDDFSIRWGDTEEMNAGAMKAWVEGTVLQCDRNYFEDGTPTERQINISGENSVFFTTRVKDVMYNENIWYPDNTFDIRVRQNIGYSVDKPNVEDGTVAMIGQYTETRIE